MKKVLVFFMVLVISIDANAQGVIKRDSSKDRNTPSSTTKAKPSTRKKSNPLAVGRYASLKGYQSITHEDGSKYEGVFNNGTLKGTVTLPDGMKLEGYFENGELEGQGKIYESDGSLAFEGVFHGGLPNGEGVSYFEGQSLHSMNWHDDFCAENITFKMSETETFVGKVRGRFPYDGIVYCNSGNYHFFYNGETWVREPLGGSSNTIENNINNNSSTYSNNSNNVKSKKTKSKRASGRVDVGIVCDIPSAILYVDGVKLGTNRVAWKKSYGYHTIRLVAPGYKEINERVLVEDGHTIFKYNMTKL